MAKKIICMLLALSMILTVLAACNNDPVVDETPDDGQQNEEIQGNDEVEKPFDGTLKLVIDGISDYVIVRGENAYISEVTASTELQKYLKQISGVEIPIVTDSTPAAEKEIVVGKTNREEDGDFDREELTDSGLLIKTKGDKLFLVGGEKYGTLYAVFEFLEAYLGCRFYTNDFEVIPEMKTITVEEIAEDKQIPVFYLRETNWHSLSSSAGKIKRKLNGGTMTSVSAEWGGSFSCAGAGFGHTIHLLAESGDWKTQNPCLTSEDVYQTVLKNLRGWLASKPDADFVSVAQTDTDSPCRCDNCKAKLAEVGTQSGMFIQFVNKLAVEIKDEYPDVKIHTFAYRHTEEPPINVVPEENVLVQLCSWAFCSNHVWGECNHEDSNFVPLLEGWAEITETLAVWDYTTNFSQYNATFPNFQQLRENIKMLADNGVSYAFIQGNSESTNGEFGELRAYLISKLLWNPYMSEEDFDSLMVQFLKDYYGAGWEYLLEYIKYAEKSAEGHCFSIYADPSEIFCEVQKKLHDMFSYPEFINEDAIRNWENVDWSECVGYYTDITIPDIIEKGYDLFAKAEASAETEEQKYRVRKASLQVEFLDLHFEGLRMNDKTYNGVSKAITNYLYYGEGNDIFTNDEKRDLKKNLGNMILEKMVVDYAARNRAYAEKLISYGITRVREFAPGNITNLDSLDFTKYPNLWH